MPARRKRATPAHASSPPVWQWSIPDRAPTHAKPFAKGYAARRFTLSGPRPAPRTVLAGPGTRACRGFWRHRGARNLRGTPTTANSLRVGRTEMELSASQVRSLILDEHTVLRDILDEIEEAL